MAEAPVTLAGSRWHAEFSFNPCDQQFPADPQWDPTDPEKLPTKENGLKFHHFVIGFGSPDANGIYTVKHPKLGTLRAELLTGVRSPTTKSPATPLTVLSVTQIGLHVGSPSGTPYYSLWIARHVVDLSNLAKPVLTRHFDGYWVDILMNRGQFDLKPLD
ncbi:MAG: hypothetical protein U0821_09715 [Chloroflexota bacterium]